MPPKKKKSAPQKQKLSEDDLTALKMFSESTNAGDQEKYGRNLHGRRAGGTLLPRSSIAEESIPLIPIYKGSALNQSLRPSCLDDVMRKVVSKETLQRGTKLYEGINARFQNGLFMPQLDLEAVGAVLQPVDLEAILTAQDEQAASAKPKEPSRASLLNSAAQQFEPWKNIRINETGKLYKPPQLAKTQLATSASTSALFKKSLHLDEESTFITLPSIVHPPSSSEASISSSGTANTRLTVEKAQKYFGSQARSDFFEQYRVMARQSATFGDMKMSLVNDPAVREGPFWTTAASQQSKKISASSPSAAKNNPVDALTVREKREPFSFCLNEMGDVIVIPAKKKKADDDLSEVANLDGDAPLSVAPEIEGQDQESVAATPQLIATLQEEEASAWSKDVYLFKQSLDTIDRSLLAGPSHQYFGSGGFSSENTKRSLDFEVNKKMHPSNASSVLHLGSIGESSFNGDPQSMNVGSIASESTRRSALQLHLQISGLQAARPDSPESTGPEFDLNAGPSMLTMDPVDFESEPLQRSPRTAYIAACIDHNVAPLPKVILRKTLSTVVDLSHYRMGDVLGSALAGGISALPSVESINLRDNNLTDNALHPILMALRNIEGVVELDLSQNKIDKKASEALATLLSDPTCRLSKLILDKADVDDAECCKFVACLEKNSSLRILDLSNNLLGSHETFVGAKTGGESLATFLNHPSCKLHTLSLSWNRIRSKSALHLASALAFNSTLTFLDLSYNGLGTAAGETLGASLLENKVLQTLVIRNNGITSTACVSLCIGIGQNLAMKEICLDENPVGLRGAAAIMNLPMIVGDRVRVSAASCNTQLKDSSCFYDPSNIVGSYLLDLSQPFQRAVAFSILQTVAAHSTCIIQKIALQALRDTEKKTAFPVYLKEEKLELVQSVASDKEEYFDASQRHALQSLRLLEAAAADVSKATALFYEADLDNSGELDRVELQLILARLGIDAANNPKRFADIMSLFDLDGSGMMGMTDFLSLVKSQRVEAASRIKEMVTYSVMALASKPGKRYVPPNAGLLSIVVVDSFVQKLSYSVMTEQTQKSTLHMAKILGDASLLNAAIKNSKLHTVEAYDLFRTQYVASGKLLPSIAQILPQMESAEEAKRLLSLVTGGDEKKLQQIKSFLGPVGKVAYGLFNGYYLLDMSLEMHRNCLSKLLEISQDVNSKRCNELKLGAIFGAAGKIGDTSQHGNWSAFRNEVFNHAPTVITPQSFTPMPQAGILEFDFCVSASRQGSAVPISNHRLCKVLNNLHLLRNPEAVKQAVLQLDIWGREVKYFRPVVTGSSLDNRTNARRSDGFFGCLECDEQRAMEMASARECFYALLLERKARYREALSLEKKGDAWVTTFLSEQLLYAARSPHNSIHASGGGVITEPVEDTTDSFFPLEEGEADPADDDADHLHVDVAERDLLPAVVNVQSEQTNRSVAIEALRCSLQRIFEVDPDFDETALMSSSSKNTPLPSATSSPASPSSRKTFKVAANQQTPAQLAQLAMSRRNALARRKQQIVAFKASRFVEVVEDTLGSVWICSRHLALLVTLLPHGLESRAAGFGSYAVELCCALFSRILDVHNFELVLRMLPPREAGILSARLGLMTLFCPLKPEGAVRLTLSRTEDRRLLKLLLCLSAAENGKRSFSSVKLKGEVEQVVEPEVESEAEQEDEGGEDEIRYKPKVYKTAEELTQEVASTMEMEEIEIPSAWNTNKGLPITGHVFVHFTAGAVKGRGELEEGFHTNRLIRRALTHCTLIDESVVDIDDEDDDELRVHLTTLGRGTVDSIANKTIANNASDWSEFLLV